MKNKILAMPSALAEMPVNPRSPATMAMIRKMRVQRNMVQGVCSNNNRTIEIIVPNFPAQIINLKSAF